MFSFPVRQNIMDKIILRISNREIWCLQNTVTDDVALDWDIAKCY